MIIKTYSRKNKSFGQLLSYINAEVERPEAGMAWNLLGKDEKEMTGEFLHNASHLEHAKGKNYLYHTILSFKRESSLYLNDDILFDCGKKFLSLYGPDTMAYGHVHKGTEKQWHLHIAHSANDVGGKQRNTHSREEYKKLKLELEQYQRTQYPLLSHSHVDHNQNRRATIKSLDSKERFAKRGKTSHKEKLTRIVTRAFEGTTSRTEFYAEIQKKGYELYKYRKRINGIFYENRKYRFSSLGMTKEKFTELFERERYHRRMREMRQMETESRDRGRGVEW